MKEGKRKLIIAALLIGALGSCQQQKISEVGQSNISPSKTFLGLLEITIDTSDESSPVATAKFVDPSLVFEGASRNVTSQSISTTPSFNGPNVKFYRNSVTFIDYNDNLATTNISTTGATRYVSASFQITNDSLDNFDNLTFLGASVPTSTFGGTSLKAIQLGDGTLLSTANTQHIAIAQKFIPSSGASYSPEQVVPTAGLTDFQIITESEASAIKSQASLFSPALDVDILQYAFVARNLVGGRDIGGSGGKGRIYFSFQIPKVNPREKNPSAFTFYAVAANETNSIASESQIQQGSTTLLDANLAVPPTEVRTLEGSRLASRPDITPFCSIKTATVRSPAADIFYSPIRGFSATALAPVTGSPDCTFGATGRRTVAGYDGWVSMTTVGTTSYLLGDNSNDLIVWSVLENGQNNPVFGTNGVMTIDFTGQSGALGLSNDFAKAIKYDAVSGDLYVVGNSQDSDLTDTIEVARVNLNGTLDTSFNTTGKLLYGFDPNSAYASGLAIQADGKLVISGQTKGAIDSDFLVSRITSGGVLDATFNVTGSVLIDMVGEDFSKSVAIDGTGNIIVGGFTDTIVAANKDFHLARLTNVGLLDPTFDTDGKTTINVGDGDSLSNLVVDSSDNILFVGTSGTANLVLARVGANGALDTSFGASSAIPGTVMWTTGVVPTIGALAIDASGNVYTAGSNDSSSAINDRDFEIRKFGSSGILDSAFGTTGVLTLDLASTYDDSTAAVIDGDNDLLVAGESGMIRIEE